MKKYPTITEIDKGTVDGQLSYWNNTLSKWKATAKAFFNSTTFIFKFGDILGDNYLEIESDGTPVKHGNATTWDDLRVSPNNAPNLGANIPIPEIVANDGSATDGSAFEFNGSTSKGEVADYAALDIQIMSLAMWIKPDTVQNIELIDRDMSGGFEFYVDNGRLYFSIVGSGNVRTSLNSIITGATQLVGVTINQEGANSRIKLYINGIVQNESVINDLLANGTDGLIIGEYNNGGWNYDGIMDDIQMYNVVLTDAQFLEMYNAGEGITGLPSGITSATDLVARFQDSLTNTATLGSGFNITGTNITIVDGIIGIITGSIGVMLESYPSGQITSKFYTMQMPHGKKLRDVSESVAGIIFNHFHWYGENLDAGTVRWGLELSWNQAGLSLPDTVIYTRDIDNDTVGDPDNANKPIQRMSNVPLAGHNPPMDEEHVSSTIAARLFRDGIADTYSGKVYLHEFDAHIEYDMDGSRLTNSK